MSTNRSKNNNKIKVLHILWSGGIGGAEEYIISLIKYFDYFKFEIHLCFLSKKGVIFEEAIKKNRNVTFIGMKNGFDIIGALRFAIYLHRRKFNIIHSHTRNFLSSAIMFFFYRTEKILTHHLSPGDIRAIKKSQLFYRIFCRIFTRIIAISEVVRKSLIIDMNVDPNRIIVIHNGIDLDKYYQNLPSANDLLYIKESNKSILGFIGRMETYKRPDLFINVAREIIEIKKEFYFIMVGDGPKMDECRKMISNYGIDSYFILLGFRRDIANILKLFDGLFFTSSGEGFGIVILEAMAMGMPVFAINDGAISEIITHKKNGILLDTTEPELTAQEITRYFEDKSLIEKIRKQSIEDVHSKFSIELCARKIEELYARMLNLKGS